MAEVKSFKFKNTYLDLSGINAKGIIKIVDSALTIPTPTRAGQGGYINQVVTIPSGYTSISAIFESSSISDSSGLQLTPIYGFLNKTGSTTVWVQYYSPNIINNADALRIKLICIKSSLLS